MAPVSKATKSRRKLKEIDGVKWQAHLQKERERDRKRRQQLKDKCLKNPETLKEIREKARLRKQKSREKKKQSSLSPSSQETEKLSPLGSYQRIQSLGKAVKKVKRLLPASPSKKKAVIRRLIDETFGPSCSKKLDLPISKTHSTISEEVEKLVIEFYHKDSISRQAPGKRDCKSVRNPKTNVKEKKQIRHLVMTVGEVYGQFIKEHPHAKIGKSRFYELRPKNILLVSNLPHNVCVCRYHLNFNYLLESISKIVPDVPADHNILFDILVCDRNLEKCMYNECLACEKKNLNVLMNDFNPNQPVTYFKWENVEAMPKKLQIVSTLGEAIESLNKQIPQFKTHCYVKRVQAEHFDLLKKSILPDQAIVQVDYAENYTLLEQDEIQSAHWSHDRVTIFTCCIWLNEQKYSYCVISDDHDHSKISTYVFLKAIISDLMKTHPNINRIDFFSDNCAAQFKNKYTISNLCFLDKDYGISNASWNFFAASHGKGAVDGVGGTIKRIVWDAARSRRFQVNSAKSFHECASSECAGIKCLFIPKTEVSVYEQKLSERWLKLIPIKGIQAHHVFKNCDEKFVLIGKTSTATMEKRKVFCEGNGKGKMDEYDTDYEVDDVFTDSESDLEPESLDKTQLKPGSFVLVCLTSEKNKYKKEYLAICQSGVLENNEVKVSFLKSYGQTNKLFITDGNKDYNVLVTDILALMPQAVMETNGSRLFYKFEKAINLK